MIEKTVIRPAEAARLINSGRSSISMALGCARPMDCRRLCEAGNRDLTSSATNGESDPKTGRTTASLAHLKGTRAKSHHSHIAPTPKRRGCCAREKEVDSCRSTMASVARAPRRARRHSDATGGTNRRGQAEIQAARENILARASPARDVPIIGKGRQGGNLILPRRPQFNPLMAGACIARHRGSRRSCRYRGWTRPDHRLILSISVAV